MKVTTKQTHLAWCVYVDGVLKHSGLTMHQACLIAENIRIEIKNGVYK
jgi:hypothetical protein